MMKRFLTLALALLCALPAANGAFADHTEPPAETVSIAVNQPTGTASATTPPPAEAAAGTTAPSPTEPPVETTDPTVEYLTLEHGAQGEPVSVIQERLSELGYYTGKISGNYLDGTRAAVRRFQKDYGLEATGVADSATLSLLMSAEYRVLAHGDEGEAVARLQEHLSALGYFEAKVTGKYREATRAAVRDFQESNGLPSTGEADVDTQRLLFSGSALKKGATPTPTPDPSLDMGDVNDVVMVEDGESTADSEGEAEYQKKLQRGAKGEQVKQVQTRLTALGFFDGPISGNYMNQTVAAVEKFQTHNGLKADGVTGQETWELLFNSDQVLDIKASPRPTPVPTPVPYAMTVDVRNQVVSVYGRDESGEYTVPVRHMICSTGLKATPSDVGEWTLNGRRARWAYFSKWGSHAQFWTRINSNIAFHSVIYNEVDYMALSVKSYNKLGQRASHGCIRLLVSDAQWVYENIGEGVVVTVTEDLPENQELVKFLEPPPLNKKYMRPSTTPEPTPAPQYVSGGMPPQPFRRLKKGAEGEDVYWLQMKLQELGHYAGAVTGGYYNGTAAAVKAFQKANGLRADGIAGTNTLEKIYEEILAANTPTPEPTEAAAFTPGPVDSPSGSPVPTPRVSPSASPAVSPTGSPAPSASPAGSPSGSPMPSASPAGSPSGSPMPSASPAVSPSASPAKSPTGSPTASPATSPAPSTGASPTGSPGA